jgi:hypothetical protein
MQPSNTEPGVDPRSQCCLHVRVFVLAIGGSASVGKTTLAAWIAERLRLDHVVHVDDLRARPECSIGQSFLDDAPGVWNEPAAWLRESLVAWTRQLHPVIAAEIDRLVAGGEAEHHGHVWVSSRPWETLPDRVIAATSAS